MHPRPQLQLHLRTQCKLMALVSVLHARPTCDPICWTLINTSSLVTLVNLLSAGKPPNTLIHRSQCFWFGRAGWHCSWERVPATLHHPWHLWEASDMQCAHRQTASTLHMVLEVSLLESLTHWIVLIRISTCVVQRLQQLYIICNILHLSFCFEFSPKFLCCSKLTLQQDAPTGWTLCPRFYRRRYLDWDRCSNSSCPMHHGIHKNWWKHTHTPKKIHVRN